MEGGGSESGDQDRGKDKGKGKVGYEFDLNIDLSSSDEEIKKMAEEGSECGDHDRREDKGKAKVDHDFDLNIDLNTCVGDPGMAADESGIVLPFKKRSTHRDVGFEISRPEPPAPPSNLPAQPQGLAGGPGSRYYSDDEICLEKTLTANEVIQQNATHLCLTRNEAIILTGDSELAHHSPGSYSKTLLVFDSRNRRYYMSVTNYVAGGLVRYALDGEWRTFVRAHNLKAGDAITIYQIDDSSVHGGSYFVIKYFRKPKDKTGFVPSDGSSSKPSDDDSKRGPKGGQGGSSDQGGIVIKPVH